MKRFILEMGLKSLEEIAIEGIYKGIVNALQQLYEPSLSKSSSTTVEVASSEIAKIQTEATVKPFSKQEVTAAFVSTIREKLDKDLVGIYRNAREYLVRICFKNCKNE